jgi:hypothetical protein
MDRINNPPPETTQYQPVSNAGPADRPKPIKIRGFLIVIALGLVVSFLQNLGQLFAAFVPFMRPEIWERLTSPAWTSYHPNWRLVMLFQLSASSTMVGLNLVALFLFFTKSRAFPSFIVFTIPAIFVLGVVDHYISGSIPAIAESKEYSEAGRKLILRFVALHVWIPYFLVSKRVSATFVN